MSSSKIILLCLLFLGINIFPLWSKLQSAVKLKELIDKKSKNVTSEKSKNVTREAKELFANLVIKYCLEADESKDLNGIILVSMPKFSDEANNNVINNNDYNNGLEVKFFPFFKEGTTFYGAIAVDEKRFKDMDSRSFVTNDMKIDAKEMVLKLKKIVEKAIGKALNDFKGKKLPYNKYIYCTISPYFTIKVHLLPSLGAGVKLLSKSNINKKGKVVVVCPYTKTYTYSIQYKYFFTPKYKSKGVLSAGGNVRGGMKGDNIDLSKSNSNENSISSSSSPSSSSSSEDNVATTDSEDDSSAQPSEENGKISRWQEQMKRVWSFIKQEKYRDALGILKVSLEDSEDMSIDGVENYVWIPTHTIQDKISRKLAKNMSFLMRGPGIDELAMWQRIKVLYKEGKKPSARLLLKRFKKKYPYSVLLEQEDKLGD
jgi:hypothetical protein